MILIPNHYPVNREGLVGWYSYRNSGSVSALGTWKDYSGNGNNGTLTNAVYVDNLGAEFNGTISFIYTADSASLAFGSGDFSFCLWIKPAVSQSSDALTMANWREDTENWGANKWSLHNRHSAAGGSYWVFWVYNIYSGTPVLKSTTPSNDNLWTFIVITRNGSTFKLYRNAVEEDSDTSANAMDAGTTENIYIGGATSWLTLNGIVDDVQIYKRALSAGEIKKLYLKNQRG